MIDGITGVLTLVQQAVQNIISNDPITSIWFALIVIMCIGVFLVGKLLNRDG